MALPEILARLKVDVQAASGVTAKTVHIGRRYVTERADFEKLHSDGTRIHAWYLYRSATEEEQEGSAGLVLRKHTLVCDGYYALLDPAKGTSMTTEVNFDAVIDAIMTSLRDDRTLNGTVQDSDLPRVDFDNNWRQIAGVTLHRAVITIENAEERILTT